MTPTERAFIIIEALPEELRQQLIKELAYWAPEVMLPYVNGFVNIHVPKSASNPDSLRVYAAVCGISEEDMEIRIILDGHF